ncbi:MAG: hypothetical protein HC878_10010 [Leptolyngbyaceae cyanobacterium SL_5_14]|nr:hypothetical protein [Leptolyngbyaceae cyanobacterium SL_5_14]
MNTCPCCSEQLLRHARHNSVLLVCPHCWQEMPNLSSAIATNQRQVKKLERLVDSLDLVC